MGHGDVSCMSRREAGEAPALNKNSDEVCTLQSRQEASPQYLAEIGKKCLTDKPYSVGWDEVLWGRTSVSPQCLAEIGKECLTDKPSSEGWNEVLWGRTSVSLLRCGTHEIRPPVPVFSAFIQHRKCYGYVCMIRKWN